jgi:hypothetical protein
MLAKARDLRTSSASDSSGSSSFRLQQALLPNHPPSRATDALTETKSSRRSSSKVVSSVLWSRPFGCWLKRATSDVRGVLKAMISLVRGPAVKTIPISKVRTARRRRPLQRRGTSGPTKSSRRSSSKVVSSVLWSRPFGCWLKRATSDAKVRTARRRRPLQRRGTSTAALDENRPDRGTDASRSLLVKLHRKRRLLRRVRRGDGVRSAERDNGVEGFLWNSSAAMISLVRGPAVKTIPISKVRTARRRRPLLPKSFRACSGPALSDAG